MSVKVAINGFGRIGRLAFRQMFGAEGFEIVAINDLTSPKMLAHLLKYDSTQGNYAAQGHVVEAGEDNIVVDGKKITIYAKANAAELPWGELGVDVVLECTGFYTSKAKAQAHIDAGAKKVVISAPAGNDLPTIVYNVNHNILTKEDNIISAASCTTNCLAPMAKALNDLATIETGIMCTIHAYTGDQMILDGASRKEFDGLYVINIVDFFDKGDDVAARAAAKAVKRLRLGIYDKGRRFFIVKRAQPGMGAAAVPQLYIALHHVHDIAALHQFCDIIARDHPAAPFRYLLRRAGAIALIFHVFAAMTRVR